MALTAQAAIPIFPLNGGKVSEVIPITGSLGANGNEIILTPHPTKFVGLVGMSFFEAVGSNLTFKSGTTTIIPYEVPDNTGKDNPIGDLILTTFVAGDALHVNSVSGIAGILFYVVEFEYLYLHIGRL